MKTTKEYPAGHSVDTFWYAIDRDGHIAEFYSGEMGWLPAEYDTFTRWGNVIGDAIQLNSTPISDGIRRLKLPAESIPSIRKEMNRKGLFSYDINCADGTIEHHTPGENTDLDEEFIELCSGCSITDLSIWKKRINSDRTLVYQISEDSTLYLVISLEFPENVLNEDVDAGRIIGHTYFEEQYFCFSYGPIEDASMDAEMIQDSNIDSGIAPLAFRLPKGFHNMKTLDVSFSETKELNLDEHIGMYNLDGECDNDDIDHFIWPYYYIHGESELEELLFVAIEKMRSRSVWCLLDQYKVRPDVFSKKRGKTAMQLAVEQYEKFEDSYRYEYPSYRILKLLRLKEKQLKQQETDDD